MDNIIDRFYIGNMSDMCWCGKDCSILKCHRNMNSDYYTVYFANKKYEPITVCSDWECSSYVRGDDGWK